MNKFKTDLLLRRRYYKEKRNTIRNFFFFFFFLLFILFTGFLFHVTNKKPVKIEFSDARLVKNEYITQNISKQIAGKNFFFISPRRITENLLLSCGLLKDVVMRKYLLPELKLLVFVKEKQLWGKLINNLGENNPVYITNEGNLVSGNYINFNLLPANLILVFCTNNKFASEATLLILKDTLDFFNRNLQIKINKFLVTDRNTLEIYMDNSIRINAGYIEPNLLTKITKLRGILNQIKKNSYLIQYIDLSLENAAVIKKADED